MNNNKKKLIVTILCSILITALFILICGNNSNNIFKEIINPTENIIEEENVQITEVEDVVPEYKSNEESITTESVIENNEIESEDGIDKNQNSEEENPLKQIEEIVGDVLSSYSNELDDDELYNNLESIYTEFLENIKSEE